MLKTKTDYLKETRKLHEGVEFVIDRAQSLLHKKGLKEPPFPPELLAPLQGIKKIVRMDLGNLDGLLIPLEVGFEIRVNIKHPQERQNFSCAHEIAHTFFLDDAGKMLLERVTNDIQGRYKKHNLEEELCNIGASELLMPHAVFRGYASRYNFSILCISPLARIFNTSIKATAIQLTKVSPKRCFVVFSMEDGASQTGYPSLDFAGSSIVKMRTPSRIGCSSFFKSTEERNSSIHQALISDVPVYSQQRMKIGNFAGFCNIESQGFGSGENRFVVSLIFPEDSD